MARPAKYPDAASRQAAYRSRVYWSQAPTQKFLATMAEGLHRDLSEALGKGSCPLPGEILGSHAGQTLQNLRDFVQYGDMETARRANQRAE